MISKSVKRQIAGVTLIAGTLAGITAYEINTKENSLGIAVDTQVGSIAAGNAIKKDVFRNEEKPGTSAANAIGRTLENMGSSFDDTRRVAGATCLIGALNDINVATGLDMYRRATADNAPKLFLAAQRSCENALAETKRDTFIIPAGVVEMSSSSPAPAQSTIVVTP